MSVVATVRERIVAVAAPDGNGVSDKTFSEIAREVGCDRTYVTSVLRRRNIQPRRLPGGGDTIHHPSLAPNTPYLHDAQAIAQRIQDAEACDELLTKLRQFHPRALPQESVR